MKKIKYWLSNITGVSIICNVMLAMYVNNLIKTVIEIINLITYQP